MRTLKLCLSTLLVLGTSAAATLNSAEARHYRHPAESVPVEAICSLPPPALYIYPAPNWEPFFRRHVYRYGPVYTLCPGAVETTNVISVRY